MAAYGFPTRDKTTAPQPITTKPPIDLEEKNNRQRKPSRILVCAPIAPTALQMLKGVGQVDVDYEADEEALIAKIGNYHALIANPNQRINSHIIKYGYNLKAIGSLDGNLDKIDVGQARALGIEVCYAPDSRSVTIAEHTIGRLLSAADKFAGGSLAGKTLALSVSVWSADRWPTARPRSICVSLSISPASRRNWSSNPVCARPI